VPGLTATPAVNPGSRGVRPLKARRLTDFEGQKLQRIIRRGSTNSVRYQRAMMILASFSGNTVPVISRLVVADEKTVRELLHAFNDQGLSCLDPEWAGGESPPTHSPTRQTSSSRRPPPARPSSADPSHAGRCANSPTTWPADPDQGCASAARACALCSTATTSSFNAPRRGKTHPTPRTRYQTRPHRTRHGALSRPDLCLRRVRPLGHPPHCRHEHPVPVRGAEPRGHSAPRCQW